MYHTCMPFYIHTYVSYMYALLHTYVCIIHVYPSTCIRMYYACVHFYMHTYVSYMYTLLHAYVCIMHVCTSTCIRMYHTCIPFYMHTYVSYVYALTHTYTFVQWKGRNSLKKILLNFDERVKELEEFRNLSGHTQVCRYIVYVCMYVCIYVCMYACICRGQGVRGVSESEWAHTHTHTHIHRVQCIHAYEHISVHMNTFSYI
jgi:hypothetical protein